MIEQSGLAAPPRDPGVVEADEYKRLFLSLVSFTHKLTNLLLVVLLFSGVLLATCLFLWSRKPDVVTWVQNSDGKVLLTVNDKSYGDIQALVARGGQREVKEEKIFAAKELARIFGGVDQDTRPAALERIVNWFRNDAAKTRDRFARALKDEANNPGACVPVGLEKTQGWQGVFNINEASPTLDNPNMIRIVGTQNLRRTLLTSNLEKRLFEIDIEMTKEGLTEQNLMTGYVPTFFQCKVLQTTIVENSSGEADLSSAPNTQSSQGRPVADSVKPNSADRSLSANQPANER